MLEIGKCRVLPPCGLLFILNAWFPQFLTSLAGFFFFPVELALWVLFISSLPLNGKFMSILAVLRLNEKT